jgi:hypothetical protein
LPTGTDPLTENVLLCQHASAWFLSNEKVFLFPVAWMPELVRAAGGGSHLCWLSLEHPSDRVHLSAAKKGSRDVKRTALENQE